MRSITTVLFFIWIPNHHGTNSNISSEGAEAVLALLANWAKLGTDPDFEWFIEWFSKHFSSCIGLLSRVPGALKLYEGVGLALDSRL